MDGPYAWGLSIASGGPRANWMLTLEPCSRFANSWRTGVLAVDRPCAYAAFLVQCLAGSYASSCFHMLSVAAAIRRASDSTASLSLTPAATVRW